MLHPKQAEFWLFPADSASGHIVEHKEERNVLAKWGNDLRQSYRTLTQSAGVLEFDVHLLMNHSLPSVNADYIIRHWSLENHLRERQDKISAGIVVAPMRHRSPTVRAIEAWLDSWWPKATALDAGQGTVSPALAA